MDIFSDLARLLTSLILTMKRGSHRNANMRDYSSLKVKEREKETLQNSDRRVSSTADAANNAFFPPKLSHKIVSKHKYIYIA